MLNSDACPTKQKTKEMRNNACGSLRAGKSGNEKRSNKKKKVSSKGKNSTELQSSGSDHAKVAKVKNERKTASDNEAGDQYSTPLLENSDQPKIIRKKRKLGEKAGDVAEMTKKIKKKKAKKANQVIEASQSRAEVVREEPIVNNGPPLDLSASARQRNDVQQQPKAAKRTTGSKRRTFNLDELPKNVLTDTERHWGDHEGREDINYGKFSIEEDKTLIAAINEYFTLNGWSYEQGREKLSARQGEKLGNKNAWCRIGTCLPNRTLKSIRTRGVKHTNESYWKGRWTEEEAAMLTQLVAKHGKKWAAIAEELGRYSESCKFKYRDLGSGREIVKGRWSFEEMENLSHLVHEHLRLKHRHLFSHSIGNRLVRDDIDWGRIAIEMNRREISCLCQWYYKLCPSMVAKGEWGNYDDMRLLYALAHCEADEEDDVNWDALLPDRKGEICFKRWRQMKKHLFDGFYSFESWLTMAIERFAPELIDEGEYESWRREKAEIAGMLGGDGDNEVAKLLREEIIDAEKIG